MATTMGKCKASSEEIKEASEGGGCSSGSGRVEHSPPAPATNLSSSSVRSARGATSKYDFVKVDEKKKKEWNRMGVFVC